MYAIESKNKRVIRQLERANIIDESSAVDFLLGNLETDAVMCPEKGTTIPRQQCLDRSGETEREACEGCENFASSRDILLKESSVGGKGGF